MKSASPTDGHLFAPERHGDADAEPGLVDFAVNVRRDPPDFVRAALLAEIDSLAAYPSASREARVRAVLGANHGRPAEEVLLLNGAAEGFELLAHLHPRHAAVVVPSFTEPARVLAAAGVRITDVRCTEPDFRLDPTRLPPDADLVVVGNPTNPTSVLHPRADIDRLRRPGRIVVVDEAFADLTRGADAAGEAIDEPESVAAQRADDVIVIRSITKTFGLAGLRAGYLLASVDVIARLTAIRRHWAVGSLAVAALEVCGGARGIAYARAESRVVARQRAAMCAALRDAGVEVMGEPAAPFVMIRVADGLKIKELLRRNGFAVRSCANFTGLGAEYLRLAVRAEPDVAGLTAALIEISEEP